MSDEIIDLGRYRGHGEPASAGSMGLWGADGERSRFALPLWRIAHLAGAERGVILWTSTTGEGTPHPFVVVDVGAEPPRLELAGPALEHCREADAATLHDLGPSGLVVPLGVRDERLWCLLADCGPGRTAPLGAKEREDVLFLAGECAGLLFHRDFAEATEAPGEP